MPVHTLFENRLAMMLWPALVSLLAAGCATEGPTCTTETREVGTCNVEYGTCEDWRGNWTSTATDVSESSAGQSAESGEFSAQAEAEAQATFVLFQELESCNCEEESIPYGRCTLIARGCFHFESPEAFTNMVPVYRTRITDKATGLFGVSGFYARPQDAFNPALEDLGTKMDLDACLR
jgi:hypothetical protein